VTEPTGQELRDAWCWESDDHVPKQPDMTAYRRRMRLHHARWREARGYPIGTQPLNPRPGERTRPVGNRLPLEFARSTGATFLTPAARATAEERLSDGGREPQQSIDHGRTYADLLWPTAFALNLFAPASTDLDAADRAVHTWWPDVPGTVTAVRFEHSPGRLDPEYLGNLVAFSVAFELALGDGRVGIVGVRVACADWNKPQAPKPQRLARYVEVSERSSTFGPDWLPAVDGTGLVHLWLEHQLVHSMLQHSSGRWSWGRYVVVHPAGNVDFARTCQAYRDLLADASTFESCTAEDLLAAGALDPTTTELLRERYLPAD
jgi:hypothetical protein